VREIELTQGRIARVDDEDYAALALHRWGFSHGYAGRTTWLAGQNKTGPRIYMHREVCPTAAGFEVDHIDGDKLNNQRLNLRAVDRGANTQNKPSRNRFGYKGVQAQPNGLTYAAVIMFAKSRRYLGNFNDPVAAARAYDAAARHLYGPAAFQNFPNG
jgi:hypothetical protein